MNKKIINIIFLLLFIISFISSISLNNAKITDNNDLINNSIDKTLQTSETSLSESYDDFRVNTSQDNMNRWNTEKTDHAIIYNDVNIDYSINKREIVTNYNDKPQNYTLDSSTIGIKDSCSFKNTSIWNFDSIISNERGLRVLSPNIYQNMINSSKRNFNYLNNLSFLIQGIHDTGQIVRNRIRIQITDFFDISKELIIYCYSDYLGSDNYFYLTKIYNSVSTTLKSIHTTNQLDDIYYFIYLEKTSSTNIRINYYMEKVNSTFETAIYNTDDTTISINEFNYINLTNRFFSNAVYLENNGYFLRYYALGVLTDSQINFQSRGLKFYRNVEELGTYKTLLKFNSWSFENTTSMFYFGLMDTLKNLYCGIVLINNTFKNIINNNTLFILKDNSLIYLSFTQSLDSLNFEIESNNETFFYSQNYNYYKNQSSICFYLTQEESFDLLNVTIYNVESPFKEAEAIRNQLNGLGTNIDTETQYKINFEGNQSDSGYYEHVEYSYNIQDFSSISGLLKAEGSRDENYVYLAIYLSPIDSNGLVNLDTDYPARIQDFMVGLLYIHWWVSSTSGTMFAQIENAYGVDLTETQVTNAVVSEISFYMWAKNSSNIQIGAKYIEPIENDFTESFDIASVGSSSIFEKTKWLQVKFVYYYDNNDDSDTKTSIGFNNLKHERGLTLEAPTLLSPSTPTLYEKPVGFFASLIGFLIAPFMWLLGAMIWVVKAIFSLPELIIKGLFDLIGFIVGIIIPALWELYSGIVEWLFETVPALEDIWEFLVDLLDLAIDTIITIFPIIPLIFQFISWLIAWIIENIYPYAEYWMNKLLNDTDTALLELFLIINAIALIPFFIAIFLKSEDIEKGNISVEDLLLDNLGYYISFWSFIYRSIISLLKTVLRLLEMIIGFIGGIIP